MAKCVDDFKNQVAEALDHDDPDHILDPEDTSGQLVSLNGGMTWPQEE